MIQIIQLVILLLQVWILYKCTKQYKTTKELYTKIKLRQYEQVYGTPNIRIVSKPHVREHKDPKFPDYGQIHT